MVQPNHVETVVAYLPTRRPGAREKWKYSRYSDNSQFWSDPQGLSLTDSHQPPPRKTWRGAPCRHPGAREREPGRPEPATTTVKPELCGTRPRHITWPGIRSSWTTWCTAGTRAPGHVRHLEALLHGPCHAKRLKPSSGTVPSQPDC